MRLLILKIVTLSLASSLLCQVGLASAYEEDLVVARLIPISTTTENGTVTMIAKLRVINKGAVAIENVRAVAEHDETVKVTPGIITIDHVPPKTALLADVTVYLTYPKPQQDDRNTRRGPAWTVEYVMKGNQAQGANQAEPPVTRKPKPSQKVLPGLRLNEIMFCPADPKKEHEWVELHNFSDAPIAASGWEICNASGTVYTLPNTLPPVPPGAFILVAFDGKDPTDDDESFKDDTLATLHVACRNIFADEGDVCALFAGTPHSRKTIRGFVSWGDIRGQRNAQTLVDYAAARSMWKKRAAAVFVRGMNVERPKGPLALLDHGGALGIPPGAGTYNHESWAPYTMAEVSPGARNGIPAPVMYLPEDETQTDSGLLTFSWIHAPWAHHYHFQLCSNLTCTTPLIDEPDLIAPYYRPQEALATPAKYYWRVRVMNASGVWGSWSETRTLIIGYPHPSGRAAPPPGARGRSGRAGHMVSGRVTDTESGNGLEGVDIDFDSTDPNIPEYSTVTLADGTWSVSGVDTGTYFIFALLEHYDGEVRIENVTGSLTSVDFLLTGDSEVLGITPLAARKDSHMLCLDGCEPTSANNRQWDGSHEALTHFWNHESAYCPYTAIAMINRYYGGSITRDEVAWRIHGQDGQPEGDLAHGVGAFDNETTDGLTWAMQASAGSLNYSKTPPTDVQLLAWIDGGRPLMYSTPIHWMVVDGYQYVDKQVQARFLNPLNDGGFAWRPFSTHSFDSYFVPNDGLTGRSTDPTVSSDADGDGIMDFDENNRFPCSAGDLDSDGDDVPDKADVASYTFRADKDADEDADGLRAEVDEDSDNGGRRDGLEDLDHDGSYEPDPPHNETDPHDPNDDQSIDLIFCIDTTGSMWDDIDAVKVAATDIVNEMATNVSDYRFALVAYRDFPVSPYGDPGDYPFLDVLAFTNNDAAAVSAIQALSVDGGADWRESVYSALMHTIDASSLGAWRGGPVKKVIVLMGDAPPHDPEPFTGYTVFHVIAAALLGGVEIDIGRDGSPIPLYTVAVGGDPTTESYFAALAEGTEGEMFTAANAGEVVDAIMEALDVIFFSPFADAGGPYEGTPGEPVTFDASGSYDPDGSITSYEWDWDGDGTYDEITTDPLIIHTWADEFIGTVRLRVTDNDDLSSIDTAAVEVTVGQVCVNDLVDVTYSGLRYDRPTGQSRTTVTIMNISLEVIGAPLSLVFNSITPGAVTLVAPDGTTVTGQPYVDFSNLLTNGELPPGEAVSKQIAFDNPDRLRFRAETSVYGVVGVPTGGTVATFSIGDLALGDMNCDGSVDVLDVDPFVLALTDADGYASAYPNCGRNLADFNGDGQLNVLDVDEFVEALTGE